MELMLFLLRNRIDDLHCVWITPLEEDILNKDPFHMFC